MALGSLLFPITVVLPAFVPVNLALSGLAVYHRGAINQRLLWRRIVPWMAIGLPPGPWLFHLGDNRVLTALFGAFVAVLAAVELWATSTRC